MPWLDNPAALYVREEVVLHRLDQPVMVTDPHRAGALFEVWELRIVYVWDATKARWEFATMTPRGYRAHARGNPPQLDVNVTTPEFRELAIRHAPVWVPDPSKARLELPAEDVWDEVAQLVEKQVGVNLGQRVRFANPYRQTRGE